MSIWESPQTQPDPPQTKSALISELADENSQLYEMLNEQRRLAESVNGSLQQQKQLNEQNSALLASTLPDFTKQISELNAALPSEITRQIGGIYEATQAWTNQHEKFLIQGMDRQLKNLQNAYERFNTQLEATAAKAEEEATQSAQRLEAITKDTQTQNQTRQWILTGLLALVYVLAILAFGSTLIDGGAFQAINQAQANIGGTGGLIFKILLLWVFPILTITAATAWAIIKTKPKRPW